ncbi:carbohydrate-binding protein [Yoonia sp. SS1-5]|uniref:Carbohydrate-binding protein n=1 Tax=Yoonia rhodophyticola TaxID=3137370 RepID=A0AAN0MA21_9RHOB
MILQGSDATLVDAIIDGGNGGALDGSYLNFTKASDASAVWTVDGAAGTFDLDIRYAIGGSTPRDLLLLVNGDVVQPALTFVSTGSWSSWDILRTSIPLVDGPNMIRLVTTGDDGPNIDQIEILGLPDGGGPIDPVDPTTATTVQAEDLVIEGGALIATDRPGFEGSGFLDFVARSGEAVTWTVSASAAETAQLDFRYALGGVNPREMRLEVNGVVIDPNFAFESTGSFDVWGLASIDVPVVAGTNTIRLISTGDSGPNLDSISLDLSGGGTDPVDPPGTGGSQTMQAETLALEGGAVVATNHPGFEGTGFVDFQADSGEALVWTVDVADAASTDLTIRYALGSGTRNMQLEVNGVALAVPVGFISTGSFAKWDDISVGVDLVAGTNTIRLISTGDSGPNLDSISLDLSGGGTDPVDPPGTGGSQTMQAETLALEGGAVVATNHPGFEGTGFVDFQADSGEALVWTVDVADAASTDLTIRYALGSGTRNMQLEVNGVALAVPVGFISTGSFAKWDDISVGVDLVAGTNTIRLVSTGQSGPNVDALTLDAGGSTPVDPPASGVDEAVQAETLALEGGAVVATNNPGFEGAGFVDFQAASGEALVWTVDAASATSTDLTIRYALGSGTRNMQLEINGAVQAAPVGFTSTGSFTNWGDISVGVDLVAGQNTIRLVSNGQSGPNVDALSLGSGSSGPRFGTVFDGADEVDPGEQGIATNASFSVSIVVSDTQDRIDASTVTTTTVRLVDDTGAAVAGTVNTTGGRDSITFTPDEELDPNTGYTLILDGVRSEGGDAYPVFSRSFETSDGGTGGGGEFNFDARVVENGDAVASLVVSDDDSQLFATTIDGKLIRWDIDQATGDLDNRQEISISTATDPRTLIGLAFDPDVPDRLWFTNNTTIFSTGENFTSKISYIDLNPGPGFSGTVTDYVDGLPRSTIDHLTNSIAFGPDGDLYVSQGSLSATGAPDATWGFRAETLLSASVLKIDTSLTPPNGGFDVRTDGAGDYDPFAPGAPVSIYATGLRNAYDLVWHSNGNLYSAINGSGAGGNSPDDPRTPADESLTGGPVQKDTLALVEAGGYYGAPNPTRDEYIRDGGNPTAGVDPNEVTGSNGYDVGTAPDPNYRGIVYDFGISRSPNGSVEYQSGAFNGNLNGAFLVTEYSGGDRVLALTFNPDGSVVDSFEVAGGFNNPLDLAVHEPSGRIYVAENVSRGSLTDDRITLLTPDAPPSAPSNALVFAEDDPLPGSDAFVFHEIEGTKFPETRDTSIREMTFENTASIALTIDQISVTGPFEVVGGPSAPVTLAAGAQLTLQVEFDAANLGANSGLYDGTLTLGTTVGVSLETDLRGLWQAVAEGNVEPDVEDVVALFGWETTPGGQVITRDELDDGSGVIVPGEATISINGVDETAYYFEAADKSEAVIIRQIGAWHQQNSTAGLSVFTYDYDPAAGDLNDTAAYGNEVRVGGLRHVASDAQTILPENQDGPDNVAFDLGGDVFSFNVQGRTVDPGRFPGAPDAGLRLIELYQDGTRIEETYLIAMDYVPGNLDYNDNMYIVSNISPFDGDLIA